MSNLGLEKFLKNLGLLLHRTGVGDRAVAKKMRSGGYNLGGEQSGHIILGDYSTTGDGIATALQVLQVIKESSRPASIACRKFIPAPQILKNVAISRPEVLECDRVQLAIKEAEQNLTNVGRLLVRPSGTEPLIRIMGEGEDRDMIRKVVEKVANTIAEAA